LSARQQRRGEQAQNLAPAEPQFRSYPEKNSDSRLNRNAHTCGFHI
jgi:hypothetical protein